MKTKYHNLLAKLKPYIICHPATLKQLNLSYMGIDVDIKETYNPLISTDHEFINRIIKMDELSFGPGGMGMPRWVLFDCALIPGAIVGFGLNASSLSSSDQKMLKVTGDEFVPLSMYIAIPNASADSWFGHNLSSLNGILEEDLKGLGLLTKYYALGVMNINKLIGATQWDSAALGLHLKLSPMKLLSSHVSIHTHENTLCYESYDFYTEQEVLGDHSLKTPKLQEFVASMEGIKKLQSEIESGEEVILYGKDPKRHVFYLVR